MAAYMIDPDHNQGNNPIVPLKISSDTEGISRSATRAAIEYAVEHEIDVINLSFGSIQSYRTCPTTYCYEFESYTSAGYIPVTLTHNYRSENGVTNTATPFHTISVGGVTDTCSGSDDYERDGNSQYGDVIYAEPHNWGPGVQCSPCYWDGQLNASEFQPTVYGAYTIYDPTNNGHLYGTSYSAPQIAAAAAIMQSNELYDFNIAKDIFHDMSYKTICPNDASREGQLLDALDAADRSR